MQKLRNEALAWLQIEEKSTQLVVKRFARRKFEQCMRRMLGAKV